MWRLPLDTSCEVFILGLMRPTLLLATIFGVTAAATNPSYLLPLGLGLLPPGTGVLFARTVLLAFCTGFLLGATLTRVFRRATEMRLGALYAALLGLLIGAFASSTATLAVGYLDLTSVFLVVTNIRISVAVLAGLTAWTLLRFQLEGSPPSVQIRTVIALIFAGAALLVGFAGVLPWEETGAFIPTWRAPVVAVAVTVLPATLVAAVLSAALAGHFSEAASSGLGLLYTLILGFYTVSIAEALSGSYPFRLNTR